MGLDLSINSTGVCFNNGDDVIYCNIVPKITRNQRRNESDRLMMIEYNKIDGNDDHNIYEICRIVENLIEEYNINKVVMEAPAFQAHGRSTITLAGLNYSIRQMLMRVVVEYETVQPTTLKKWFTGNGMADKGMMVRCWKVLDPIANTLKAMKIDDLADSYALWCWE